MGLVKRDGRDDVDVESCLANLDRLAAVRRSGLADGLDRDRLDGLTLAASERLKTPMAFMSIVEDKRIVFAGMAGVTGELADSRQSTPEASYCMYVAALDEPLIVHDSTVDLLVRDHPATTGSGVRAYLGVPLRRNGHCLGSFCVVDVSPRAWTDEDLLTLEGLAMTAMTGAGGT